MISGSFTGQIQTSDRTHKFNMKKHIINAAIFLALQGPLAWLATAAAYSDNSGNYTSWTDGSNAGTGFGAWSFYSDNHGSGYAGLEKSFGQSDNMRASDNSEWKLYAVDYNTSASGGAEIEEATAYRALNSSLAVGQSFSLSFEYRPYRQSRPGGVRSAPWQRDGGLHQPQRGSPIAGLFRGRRQ